jgi:hypothetical protein
MAVAITALFNMMFLRVRIDGKGRGTVTAARRQARTMPDGGSGITVFGKTMEEQVVGKRWRQPMAAADRVGAAVRSGRRAG